MFIWSELADISDKAIKGNYAENKYRYNDKELQSKEFVDGSGLEEYDYGARFYDPQIARWTAIDPMAESDSKSTGFKYVFNNPVSFVDPDGQFGDYYQQNGNYLGSDGKDDDKTYVVKENAKISSLKNQDGTTTNIFSYTQWWSNNVGKSLNNFFSNGPLSPTTQTFDWNETIKYK